MGRFITEDPIKDGNNWYMYCRNNPLSYIDPTGLVNYRPTGASKYAINQISGSNRGSGNGSGSNNRGGNIEINIQINNDIGLNLLGPDSVNVEDLKYNPYDWAGRALTELMNLKETILADPELAANLEESFDIGVESILDEMINQEHSPFEYVDRDIAKKLLLSILLWNEPEDTAFIRGIKDVRTRITSEFGERAPIGGFEGHDGVDTAGAPEGHPVVAGREGEVIKVVESDVGFGNYVKIKHPTGEVSYAAHLHTTTVTTGDKVKVGEQIGTLGNSGNSKGVHLHTEVRVNGTPVNINGSFVN